VGYIYANATNANDYGFIFEDYYTNEYGKPGDWGEYTQTDALDGGWNHVNVAPGKMALEAEFPEGFLILYKMPNITGNYYLIVIADYYNVIQESDEENNTYMITAAGGAPLQFNNGVMQSIPAQRISADVNVLDKEHARAASPLSLAQLGNLNGYTSQEIMSVIKRDRKNGTLAKKAAEFRANNPASAKRMKKRQYVTKTGVPYE
jgi:hypothetical protein